jgi:peptidoglycan/xylan/chitin deacetylase (PgdA/CDA1 family)
MDSLREEGCVVQTVSELASSLREGRLEERAVAVTFDDGYDDVAVAASAMLERDMRGTVFCVAGHLGGQSDWPTMPSHIPRHALADAGQLAGLAEAGFEIGSHGMEHAPLLEDCAVSLDTEIVESRAVLERDVGVRVRSFAFPYGVAPTAAGRKLLEQEYEAACGGGLRRVTAADDPLQLPRMDAHYLRRPLLLRHAVRGSLGPYLALRRAGARARRLAQKDWAG